MKLNSCVVRIEECDDHIKVKCADGTEYRVSVLLCLLCTWVGGGGWAVNAKMIRDCSHFKCPSTIRMLIQHSMECC